MRGGFFTKFVALAHGVAPHLSLPQLLLVKVAAGYIAFDDGSAH